MIQIGHHKIRLTLEEQTSPQGRAFRLSGSQKGDYSIWVKNVEKSEWIHHFKYLDKQGGFVSFLIDVNGKFKKKL